MRGLTTTDDFWNFDLALLPQPLVSRFSPIPDTLEVETFSEWRAFAAKQYWSEAPWRDHQTGEGC